MQSIRHMLRRSADAAVRTVVEPLEQRRLLSGGLSGSYFASPDFIVPVASRIDQTINFDWQPSQVQSTGGQFAVRWTGQISAKFSEFYTFYTSSNGGVRLTVNGKILIDDLDNTTQTEHAVLLRPKLLTKQKYDIQLDYLGADASNVQLMYSSTRTPKQVIPHQHLLPAVQQPFSASISFADYSSPRHNGYVPDNGAIYMTHRRSGLTYGWDEWNDEHDFNRDSSRSYSERYDTGAAMQPNGANRSWSIAVPNGTYEVRVIAGDPDFTDSYYSIDVEGRPAIRGQASQYSRWHEGTVRVTVMDGRLNITNGAGAVNNKINFVQITPADEMDRFVSEETIGFSSNILADRMVGVGIKDWGWQGFIDNYIEEKLDRGYRRFVLHNPFGVSEAGEMQLDQYFEAQKAGLTWLYADFVEAWKPITDSGVEVIAYLGNDGNDADFGATREQYLSHFWASVAPALEAGMSIALDAAVLSGENSYLYEAAQILRSMDVKVYVEARPIKQLPHWRNFDFICTERFWERSDPAKYQDSAVWAYRNEELTNEVLRWVDIPPDGETWHDTRWVIPEALKILKDGHTAYVPPFFHLHGLTPQGILARANGFAG